jgi:uncharacterized protein YlxP (DUF503 family)
MMLASKNEEIGLAVVSRDRLKKEDNVQRLQVTPTMVFTSY